MIPVKTTQTNKVLTAPLGSEGEVRDLYVTTVKGTDGSNYIESCWKMSFKERLKALFAGYLYFSCWGNTHPPISLSTESHFYGNKPIRGRDWCE